MKSQFYIFLAAILFSGCATLPDSSFREGIPVALSTPTVCIQISFFRTPYDFLNNPRPPIPFESEDADHFRYELKQYGIETNCEQPLARYKLIQNHFVPWQFAQGAWMTLSVLTVGILPYYGKQTINYALEREGAASKEFDVHLERVISIFALPKAILDERESDRLYNSMAVDRAMISKPIAQAIRDDLKAAATEH